MGVSVMDGATSFLSSMMGRLPGIGEAAVMDMANRAADIYRDAAPTPLKNSIHVEGSGMHASVVADADKVNLFRHGSRPHEEVVRSGGKAKPYALGTTVGPFFRVHHPGTKPLDWESNAYGSAEGILGDFAAGLDP